MIISLYAGGMTIRDIQYHLETSVGIDISHETFTNDESAIKTLWLMICNIEDKRARKRAKEGKRAAATSGRIVEGGRVANWKQAINQMAVAYPDRFRKYL